jgi:hypothetical protein
MARNAAELRAMTMAVNSEVKQAEGVLRQVQESLNDARVKYMGISEKLGESANALSVADQNLGQVMVSMFQATEAADSYAALL